MKLSVNDNKKYQTITLDNGLRLVFVTDKECNKSACSLVINTGSFDDPVDRPGFAHFIEHLLFNGNRKYPAPNEMSDFIAKRGGQSNAWTATEHSCFHFDINHDYLGDAIDHFGHLFIDPLFADSAIAREQEAIHAEYKLKLQDDSRRIQQVHKETSNVEHPFNKFSVGNRHTLSDLPERPVKKELLDFWTEQYQAQFMTVCIVAPTNELFEKSTAVFSLIQSKGPHLSKTPIHAPLYTKSSLAKFICIRPVKELHKLNLTYALPAINHLYKNKMVSFIAHLLGHEGKGSLYEMLKSKGLINALSAGNGISGQNFKDFNISLELTELGENQLDQILTHVSTYIRFMKSELPPNYLYEEQKKLSETSFEYQESTKSIKYANQIALNMQHYEGDDYLFGDYRMDGFVADQWQQIFSYFTSSNMRITLVSQNISTDKEAHWYHTPYAVQDIDSEVLEQLDNVEAAPGTYQYPCPNPYLQSPIKIEEKDLHAEHPISLDESDEWLCWFKQDLRFRMPKGNIYVGIDLPKGIENAKSQAMMRLFCELFMDTVAETHYQAEMAGLHYNFYAHGTGVTLYTSGLSGNQKGLLLTLIDTLFSLKVTRSRYEEIKRQLIKHWRNSESNKPISQLFSLLNAHLLPNSAAACELADNLDSVAIDEFRAFSKNMFQDIHVEVLIYGNWNLGQATAINESVKEALKDCSKSNSIAKSVRKIESTKVIELSKKVEHQDSAALLYLQGLQIYERPIDDIEKAYFILISQIIAPFVFNRLRTEKQLGYMVGSGYMPLCNVPGLAIYVQSHDYSSDQLTNELHECLLAFNTELLSLSNEDFFRHKSAVINQYKEQPNNMSQQSQQLWIAIGNKDYDFDHKSKIVQELENLELRPLIAWYSSQFAPNLSKGIQVSSV